ncbi:GDSL family lipase [Alicyclobacillus tengchongensis]|nr:GDSL family lipase [Alicyclobacillus tengchongensis]
MKQRHNARFTAVVVALTGVICASLTGCGTSQQAAPSTRVHATQPTTTVNTTANPKPAFTGPTAQPITVMAVGGSVAHGWDDKTGGGYLARAFQTLTDEGPVSFAFVNKSIEGDGPTQMAAKYPGFLAALRPRVVVISWGMLDDIANKTPIPAFKKAIQDEISLALKANADVIVGTPPTTGASYGHDVQSEANLINIEVSLARSFHSQHVYVFDLFTQMKQYLASHHQSINQYSADAWHPNTLGHELAGEILAGDLATQFVKSTKSNSATSP